MGSFQTARLLDLGSLQISQFARKLKVRLSVLITVKGLLNVLIE